MATSIKSAIVAVAMTFGVLAASAYPASAALFHGGGGGFHGGGFHGFGGFRGGGFHGFHSFGGFHRGFRGGGFHGGFARGFRGGGFHSLMAGRHWNYYHSNGRFGTGWGRHGGFIGARDFAAPRGFASGLGRQWASNRFDRFNRLNSVAGGYGATWSGYGGYGGYGGDGGWGGYYSDYDGLWGGAVFGLAGLAAGLAIGNDDCLIYSPVYDNLGQYLGVEPINICSF